jgi:hypothetical protein
MRGQDNLKMISDRVEQEVDSRGGAALEAIYSGATKSSEVGFFVVKVVYDNLSLKASGCCEKQDLDGDSLMGMGDQEKVLLVECT